MYKFGPISMVTSSLNDITSVLKKGTEIITGVFVTKTTVSSN